MSGSRALHSRPDGAEPPSTVIAAPRAGATQLAAAVTSTPPARRVFALQREVSFRARAAIFGSEGPLGGIPTLDEELAQDGLDRRAARAMAGAFRAAVHEGRGADLLSGRFAGDAAERWRAKAPAALAFGARTFDGLALLGPRGRGDSRWRFTAAAFQLAASLLDWIGDEAGAAREMAAALPPETLRAALADPASRHRFTHSAPAPASPIVMAFRRVLRAMIASAPERRSGTARLWTAVADAYAAELTSFDRGAADAWETVALEKSLAPTVVVGEIARLACGEPPGGVIDRARHAVAPVFALVDDLADLAADLRKGHLNTLAPAGPPRADPDVARVLDGLLASSAVAAAAQRVADHLTTLDRLLADAAVPPSRRQSASEWLRVVIWRWLS